MQPLLEVAKLRAGYGPAQVLHGVDLSVSAGEIVSIIGPNGCGKSTLLKSIMGYVPWSKGDMRLEGRSILGRQTEELVGLGLGFVPQLANTFKGMTVRENLELGGYTLDRAAVSRRIEELVGIFPILGPRMRQKAGTMSGGERQTVALASALMAGPRLLLLDEPSAGLSPSATSDMFASVKELPARLGITVLMVEQDVYGALEISDRGYVLAMGQNEFSGSAADILNDRRIGIAYLGMDPDEHEAGNDAS
jgi:ABC-type branched-subunit amino acid transport system ATPase component